MPFIALWQTGLCLRCEAFLVEEDVAMTGGVIKNSGVFDALSDGTRLRVKALEDIDPQINPKISVY